MVELLGYFSLKPGHTMKAVVIYVLKTGSMKLN